MSVPSSSIPQPRLGVKFAHIINCIKNILYHSFHIKNARLSGSIWLEKVNASLVVSTHEKNTLFCCQTDMVSLQGNIICIDSPLGFFWCWWELNTGTDSKKLSFFCFIPNIIIRGSLSYILIINILHASFARTAKPWSTHYRRSIHKIHWSPAEVVR